jgi:hypothetical protein
MGQTRCVQIATVMAMLVVFAGCKNPVGATVALDREFTIAPKSPVVAGDDGLVVEFLRVTGDSRCPVDVVCIQGGDAVVHVQVEDSRGRAERELHSSDSSKAAGIYRQYTITLIELQPFPFSGRTIPQDDYRATLKVTR